MDSSELCKVNGDSDVITPLYGLSKVVILSNPVFKSDVRISF